MIWKVLLFALAAYALYRLFMSDKIKKNEKKVTEKENLIATGEMVKDPICGAYVDKDSAVSVRSGDKVTYFCSYDCRKQYMEQLEERKKIEENK